MKVIRTTDLSRTGNDCYIYETVSLLKTCDVYVVLNVIRYTVAGLNLRGTDEEISIYTHKTRDLDEAECMYNQVCDYARFG